MRRADKIPRQERVMMMAEPEPMMPRESFAEQLSRLARDESTRMRMP